MSDQVKFVLDESHLPEAWYNLVSDLPEQPPPVLHPGTGEPVGPDDLAPLFPMQIILQEVATDQYVPIPEEVRSVYRQWRPTPLYRARRLEEALGTPARIYYKYEGVAPTGAPDPNPAVAAGFYSKRQGVSRLTDEPGRGQCGAVREDTKYSLGSVLNHVLMHQTGIGQEAQLQLEQADDYPDILLGRTGGGSNFSGLSFPFLGKALREGKDLRAIAVEPAACPSLTKGRYAFDFGDTGHLTPLVKMHTLGSTFVPPPFHAGGLRYHGMAPLVSHLQELGLIESRAYTQTEVFAAGVEFARVEGILPAPEANTAVKATIDEASRCRRE